MSNESTDVFVGVVPALYSDDDLCVIVQDWDETDPDQCIAINLAAELLRKRKVLRRIFEQGMRPEGHPYAGDHEFCGSHHAECIALAREELDRDSALNQRGGGDHG